jgi:branched-chain amino acid transport system substrate-binding protein
MNKALLSAAVIAASLTLPGSPVMAQSNEVTIGISISTTGPAAALGIPERNALEFVPKEIGGVPVKVIVLDDGGDPTAATTNARRFVTESKADIIMGSSTTPPSIAVSTVANEAGIPISGWRRSRSTKHAGNGRSTCRSRFRSWARCSTST